MKPGVCDDQLIAQDIVPSCTDPVVQGFESEGVIINRVDVDFTTSSFNATSKNIIETLALKSGKKGYRIAVMGSQPFNGTNTAFAAGTYRNSFTHTVSFVVMDDGPDVREKIIDGLANGEFVIVLENKFKGLQKAENKGAAAFQVYGWYQGLKPTEMADGKYSDETDGGWMVTLQEVKSPKSGMYLFKTDYETTATAVKTLLTEAS